MLELSFVLLVFLARGGGGGVNIYVDQMCN